MANKATPNRATTPPKGRPTRSRHDVGTDRRIFGPAAQWLAFAVLLILAFLVLVMLTNGGDFNPLNDQNGGQIGTIAAAIGASSAPL